MLLRGLGGAMRRRDFIKVVTGCVAVLPLATHAQQTSRVPRIGVLAPGRANNSDTGLRTLNAFVPALREFGYNEGQNITLERKFADGNVDKLRALATELVEHQVDVIVAFS